MTRIIAMFNNGAAWVCDADASGSGDAGQICAAAGTVEITQEGLVYTPKVLAWDTGAWRRPQGVKAEWSITSPGYRSSDGEMRDVPGYATTEHNTSKKSYGCEDYVLLNPEQLEDVVSVTVDGVLVFTREGGSLVPVAGFDAANTSSGRTDDFTRDNHASPAATQANSAYERSRGISFDPEWA